MKAAEIITQLLSEETPGKSIDVLSDRKLGSVVRHMVARKETPELERTVTALCIFEGAKRFARKGGAK